MMQFHSHGTFFQFKPDYQQQQNAFVLWTTPAWVGTNGRHDITQVLVL